MDKSRILKEYYDLINNSEDYYYGDYKNVREKIANSTAIYKGKPIPFLYQPIFYNDDDIKYFEEIAIILMSITDKVTDKYLTDKSFRKKFRYSDFLEKLILSDNGYGVNVPIGRFDIFYNGIGDFKFCEFNTDGSSAMNEDNVLAEIILETEPINILKEKYSFKFHELFDSWVTEIFNIYETFDNKVDNPNIAIVDFEESGTSNEFIEFKKVFEKRGFNCIIADPRDLIYKDGKLYKDDYNIDLIYRRIVTKELMDQIDKVTDFVNAYKDKVVCVVGSIKSQLMHNKIIFQVLHDKDTLAFLDDDEIEFVKNHIPYTVMFKDNKELYNLALDNKDDYIIKPTDLNASRGVYAGKDWSQSEWKDLLDKYYGEEYLLQEYCVPPKVESVTYENGNCKIEKFGHILGLFFYNKKFKGMYSRVGKDNIISGLHSYYTMSNIVVGNRK